MNDLISAVVKAEHLIDLADRQASEELAQIYLLKAIATILIENARSKLEEKQS